MKKQGSAIKDQGSANAGKPRILIADDEQSMREWMRLLFQRDGFEVLTAEDGIAAREMIAREYVDVVLTDIRMPRLDGVSLLKSIRESAPDVLFVALETPAKELFLARHRDRLQVPFVMGVGGAVDILGGVRRRAPRWLQRFGLEWAYRLAQDPRRLAGRYVVGNTRFTWLVMREFFRQRLGR